MAYKALDLIHDYFHLITPTATLLQFDQEYLQTLSEVQQCTGRLADMESRNDDS